MGSYWLRTKKIEGLLFYVCTRFVLAHGPRRASDHPCLYPQHHSVPPCPPQSQIRVKDYTGAGQALTKGSPPANQLGGRCEAQHLWLSLAKLALLAGGGGSGRSGGGDASATADAARGSEIQRRLELAEVRERLVESRLSAEGGTVSANKGGGEVVEFWSRSLVVFW